MERLTAFLTPTYLVIYLLAGARKSDILLEDITGLDQLLAFGPVVKCSSDVHLGGRVFPTVKLSVK